MHTDRFRRTFLVFVALAALAAPLSAQDAADLVDHTRGVVSANEEALVKAEVIRTVELYYQHFSSGEVERISQETHMLPWVFLGAASVTRTAEETAQGYRERRQMVIDDLNPDYAKSTYTTVNVCVLSRNAAITSGYNTRTTSTGEIITIEGVAYIVTKTPAGWRIAAFSETTPEKVIRC